jgi:hypothetical protein
MAFVYEVNGQRVEFETEPTEADIDEAARSLGPAPESPPPPEEASAVTIPGAVIPGETGLANLGRQALDVGIKSGTAAMNSAIAPVVEAYTKNPLRSAAIDVGSTMLTGAPLGSGYQFVKSIPERLKIAKDAAAEANAALSRPTPKDWTQSLERGKLPDPADAYREMRARATKIDPAYSKILQQAEQSGSDPAIKKVLEKGVPDALKNDPKFAAQMKQYLNVAPGIGTKVRRVVEPIVRGASKVLAPAAAAFEGTQAYQQARQGDYTGATMSALNAASMFNPAGILAQPGLAIMQSANKNFRSQTPAQQRESSMDALSGTAPGMYGGDIPQYTTDDYEDAKTSKQITMAVRMKAAKKVLGQR